MDPHVPDPSFDWNAVDEALTQRADSAGVPRELAAERSRAATLAATVRHALAYSSETPDDLDTAFEAIQRRIRGASVDDATGVGRRGMFPFGTRTLPTSGGLGKQTLRHVTSNSSAAAESSVRSRTLSQQRVAPNALRQTTPVAIAITAVILGIVAVVNIKRRDTPIISPVSTRTYITESGKQTAVTLSDGSRALLGPATTLTVTTHPTDAYVDVHVTGQVLFTVNHNRTRQFRVQSGRSVVRVLGTTFLARHYATDRVVRVVVIDGRVSLNGVPGTSAHVLDAHTVAVVDDSGQVRVTPNTAVEDYTAWTRGQLVFRKTPVCEIVAELGRTYGVDIRLADSAFGAQTLTWTVPVQQRSLANVLWTLTSLLDAHAMQHGRVITIVPGPTPAPRLFDPRSSSHSENHYGR